MLLEQILSVVIRFRMIGAILSTLTCSGTIPIFIKQQNIWQDAINEEIQILKNSVITATL